MMEWKQNALEVDHNLLFQYEEPCKAGVRQLQRCVVPSGLCRMIIVAYHATPMSSHSGIYKTYYRIAARFWWPQECLKWFK
jgi:hypothetical protein